MSGCGWLGGWEGTVKGKKTEGLLQRRVEPLTSPSDRSTPLDITLQTDSLRPRSESPRSHWISAHDGNADLDADFVALTS